jgi:hypothetical protein
MPTTDTISISYATRMEVVPVMDLTKERALSALKKYRAKYFNDEPTSDILEKVYTKVGGRLSFLNRVAKSEDMMDAYAQIHETEKTWFLNQFRILSEGMDDDAVGPSHSTR